MDEVPPFWKHRDLYKEGERTLPGSSQIEGASHIEGVLMVMEAVCRPNSHYLKTTRIKESFEYGTEIMRLRLTLPN